MKFFDDFGLAARGLLLAMRQKIFWIVFLITFFVFGTLLNLLAGGFGSFRLIFASGGTIAGKIIKDAFLGIFGVNKNFLDFLINLCLAFLQSTLISLVVFIARHNQKEKQTKRKNTGVETSAIVAGLMVLGSGCPTCGTTLLAPVIGTVISGSVGAFSLAGKLSIILNVLAIIIGLLAFRELGLETYAIIKSEKYLKKREQLHEKSD